MTTTGTLLYYTPEMLRSQGHDQSLDAWCLGVLTYELLTGKNPFLPSYNIMNHEMVDSIQNRKKPFTVDYTGFGWVMIRKGVFENKEMKYPWFAPKMQVFESGAVQDMCGEDVSFCLDAIEAGYEIWCDPRIRVGHEKTRVI